MSLPAQAHRRKPVTRPCHRPAAHPTRELLELQERRQQPPPETCSPPSRSKWGEDSSLEGSLG